MTCSSCRCTHTSLLHLPSCYRAHATIACPDARLCRRSGASQPHRTSPRVFFVDTPTPTRPPSLSRTRRTGNKSSATVGGRAGNKGNATANVQGCSRGRGKREQSGAGKGALRKALSGWPGPSGSGAPGQVQRPSKLELEPTYTPDSTVLFSQCLSLLN